MRSSNIQTTSQQIVGVVRRVDTINRELHVETSDSVLILDIPCDCTIRLHGERVKLRMLQPLDQVRVTCKEDDNSFVAQILEAQPD